MNNSTYKVSRRGFTLIAESGTIAAGNAAGTQQTSAENRVERSIRFMTANLNRSLSVPTLAAEVNVSVSYLFALFRQSTGYAPMSYFTKLRMGEACRLLDSTAASVKEVAAMLGYNDPYYFSRVFKSLSALPPTHYRRLSSALRREVQAMFEPRRQLSPEAQDGRDSTTMAAFPNRTAKSPMAAQTVS